MIYRWQVTKVSSVYQYQYACLFICIHQPCTHGQEVAFFRNSNDIFSFFPLFFDRIFFFPLTIPCSKKSFYFLALQDFIDREGEAPLEGSIPDMTSSTELATYISSPTTSCSFSPPFSNFWERKYDLAKLEVCLMPLAGYMLPCRRSTKPRLRLIFLLLSKMWAIF